MVTLWLICSAQSLCCDSDLKPEGPADEMDRHTTADFLSCGRDLVCSPALHPRSRPRFAVLLGSLRPLAALLHRSPFIHFQQVDRCHQVSVRVKPSQSRRSVQGPETSGQREKVHTAFSPRGVRPVHRPWRLVLKHVALCQRRRCVNAVCLTP